MSYKKVQQLASKFIKIAKEEQDYSFQESSDSFAYDFIKKIRTALNEIEGDLVTLKYREFDKTKWKELGNFWRACIAIYKAMNRDNFEDSFKEFSDLLLEKKDWLTKIIPAIQQHLKNTEIDFIPHPNLSQARANGLKELIKVVNEGAQNIKNNVLPSQAVTVRPPSSKSTLVSNTRKSGPTEKTQISETKVKKEAL